MSSSRLKLNPLKMEFTWAASRKRQHLADHNTPSTLLGSRLFHQVVSRCLEFTLTRSSSNLKREDRGEDMRHSSTQGHLRLLNLVVKNDEDLRARFRGMSCLYLEHSMLLPTMKLLQTAAFLQLITKLFFCRFVFPCMSYAVELLLFIQCRTF